MGLHDHKHGYNRLDPTKHTHTRIYIHTSDIQVGSNNKNCICIKSLIIKGSSSKEFARSVFVVSSFEKYMLILFFESRHPHSLLSHAIEEPLIALVCHRHHLTFPASLHIQRKPISCAREILPWTYGNENAILMKVSSFAAPYAASGTTYGNASAYNVVNNTFPFQWISYLCGRKSR